MQAGGVAKGAIPRRRRLNVVLAIAVVVAIAALTALLVRTVPLATGGVEAGAANPGAGAAVLHDDAGDVHPGAGSAIVHDDAGEVNR